MLLAQPREHTHQNLPGEQVPNMHCVGMGEGAAAAPALSKASRAASLERRLMPSEPWSAQARAARQSASSTARIDEWFLRANDDPCSGPFHHDPTAAALDSRNG